LKYFSFQILRKLAKFILRRFGVQNLFCDGFSFQIYFATAFRFKFILRRLANFFTATCTPTSSSLRENAHRKYRKLFQERIPQIEMFRKIISQAEWQGRTRKGTAKALLKFFF